MGAPKNAAHFSIRFQQCRYDMWARSAARVIFPVARISLRKSSITSIDWPSSSRLKRHTGSISMRILGISRPT